MPTDYTNETHLSKDELLEILNEIDTEGQRDPKDVNEQRTQNTSYPIHPNPSNQFY